VNSLLLNLKGALQNGMGLIRRPFLDFFFYLRRLLHTGWRDTHILRAQMLASWDKITETKGLARVKVDLP
jgi:hypothetical protein